ncbi:hypothetical protein Q9966_016785 [Columba livia]|nr:hypothetical protein Q9966_016785 [Columba livia]
MWGSGLRHNGGPFPEQLPVRGAGHRPLRAGLVPGARGGSGRVPGGLVPAADAQKGALADGAGAAPSPGRRRAALSAALLVLRRWSRRLLGAGGVAAAVRGARGAAAAGAAPGVAAAARGARVTPAVTPRVTLRDPPRARPEPRNATNREKLHQNPPVWGPRAPLGLTPRFPLPRGRCRATANGNRPPRRLCATVARRQPITRRLPASCARVARQRPPGGGPPRCAPLNKPWRRRRERPGRYLVGAQEPQPAPSLARSPPISGRAPPTRWAVTDRARQGLISPERVGLRWAGPA